MAIPMRALMPRILCAWLFVAAGLLGLISCSAAEDRQRSPVENAPGRHRAGPASAGTEAPPASTPTATSSAARNPTTGPKDILALPCGARLLRFYGDPPRRALSQSVPDRACSEDGECGDGFCDRGRCAPIWEEWYGQRCTLACQCGPFLCLEGRCRSCLHHGECVENKTGNACAQDGLFTSTPLANACGTLGLRETHPPREPVRPPPTP
jgi:hypothetical protein